MSTEGMPEFTLADLPTADLGDHLQTVQRNDPAARALTIMIANGFSQVPVRSGSKRVVGVVTWRSLACHNVEADTTVDNVREPIPGGTMFLLTTPVVDVLDLVFSDDFVLTCNREDELRGIVTASDMTLWAKHASKAFLAVAEIERHFRGVLSNVEPGLLNSTTLTATANTSTADGVHQPDSWTFARYRSFFDGDDDAWFALPQEQMWSRIDRREFRKRLREANDARNRAFHFRSDRDDPTAAERAVEREADAALLAKFAKCLRVIAGS